MIIATTNETIYKNESILIAIANMSGSKQESFQSMATVFILENKTWIERGSGAVRFEFDLNTFALRLIIRPGTSQQFECKLRPRIRSKGPRAYVVRAQAENGTDEHILAVRFEREEDSRSFRLFVEKRDVDKSQSKHKNSGMTMTSSSTRKNTNYSTSQSGMNHFNPRHANRTSSNIAMNNGYGAGPGPYGYAAPSSMKANYFWTCSACFQMVDPSLTSCQICGTLRGDQAQSHHVLQSMQHQQQLSYHPHQSPPQQRQPMNMVPNPYQSSSYIPQVQQQQQVKQQMKPIPIIKLTSANLEKHNKLYPSKRKSDKESLLKKLIIINCQQAVVV